MRKKFDPIKSATSIQRANMTQNYERSAFMGVPAYHKAQLAEQELKRRQALLNMSREDEERWDNIKRDAKVASHIPKPKLSGQTVRTATGRAAFANLKAFGQAPVISVPTKADLDRIIANAIAQATK